MDLKNIEWKPTTTDDYREKARAFGIVVRKLIRKEPGVIIGTFGSVFIEDIIKDFVGHPLAHQIRYTDNGGYSGVSAKNPDVGYIVSCVDSSTGVTFPLSLEFNDGRMIESNGRGFINPRLDVFRYNEVWVVGGLSIPNEYFSEFNIESDAPQVVGIWNQEKYVVLERKHISR